MERHEIEEAILNPLIDTSKRLHRKGQHARRDTGLIYFVEAVGLDRLKIGYTTGRFDARLPVIQTGSPVPLQPLLVWKHATMRDEADLHRLFKQYRSHNEWYILNATLLLHMEMLRDSAAHDTLVWDNALDWLREKLIEETGTN